MCPETTKERAGKIVSYLKQNCTLPADTPDNLLPASLEKEIEQTLNEAKSFTNSKQENQSE